MLWRLPKWQCLLGIKAAYCCDTSSVLPKDRQLSTDHRLQSSITLMHCSASTKTVHNRTAAVALFDFCHKRHLDSRAAATDAVAICSVSKGGTTYQDAWGCCRAPPDCDDPALLCTVVPDTDAGALPGFMTLMSTFCKQQPGL